MKFAILRIMNNAENWREYLGSLLTTNKQFAFTKTEQAGDTQRDFYRQQLGDSETIIMVACFLKDGRLIELDITNPKTPGNNAEQDYFDEDTFDETLGTAVGLTFSEVNKKGVTALLKSGFSGIEKKYFKNGKLQFSKTYKKIHDDDTVFEQTHYFDNKNFWLRSFEKLTKPEPKYDIEEIDLKNVFKGLA